MVNGIVFVPGTRTIASKKAQPQQTRPGYRIIYLANFANTVWKASTVLAMCSSVCAVDRNMPSN